MDDKSRSSCDTIDFSTYTTPGLLIQDNVTFLKRLRCDIAVINSGPWNWQTSSGNIDGWDLFSRELIYFVWMMYIIYSLSSQRVLFVPGAGSDLRRQIDYWKKRQKAPMSSSAGFFFSVFPVWEMKCRLCCNRNITVTEVKHWTSSEPYCHLMTF